MAYTDHIFTGYRRRLTELKASANPLAQGVVYIEGSYVPVKEARIPILDQGFLHSDLTYDVPGSGTEDTSASTIISTASGKAAAA